jgi:hypothetical protein
MKSIGIFVALWLLLPMGALKAEETPDSSKETPSSEAAYAACIKQAQALQERFAECTTKECRDAVTNDFRTWSAKCFKE